MMLRSGAVGDTLLLLPFLRWLAGRYSPAEFTLAGQPERLGVIASQLDSTAIIDLDRSFAWLFADGAKAPDGIRRLFEMQDWVIRFSSSPGDEADMRLRAMGDFYFQSVKALPGPDYEKHSVYYPFDALKIDAPVEAELMRGLCLRIPSGISSEVEGHSIQRLESPTLAFAPGAGSASKRWPVEGWEQVLGDLRGIRKLMILGPAEQDRASGGLERLEKLADEVVFSPTLEDLALILSRCLVFVGCDSGITHLAAITGIPTLALFGPTDPGRWGPIGGKTSILQGDLLLTFPRWLKEPPGTYPPASLKAISPRAVTDWLQTKFGWESHRES